MKSHSYMNNLRCFLLLFLVGLLAFQSVQVDAQPTDVSADLQTVLVTGANRGLGLEMARQFHSAGYHVIGTARNPERANELKQLGVQVEQLDVLDVQSVAVLRKRLAGQPIDILINNAGVFGPVPLGQPQPTIDDMNVEEMFDVVNVNTFGPLRITQALIDNLRATNTRKVVNISSRQGILERDIRTNSAYGYRVSKTALNMMTRAMAGDLEDEGFVVVSLGPGWVQTDMGTERADLTPEQSVQDIRKFIDSMTIEHTGGFWLHDGTALPW